MSTQSHENNLPASKPTWERSIHRHQVDDTATYKKPWLSTTIEANRGLRPRHIDIPDLEDDLLDISVDQDKLEIRIELNVVMLQMRSQATKQNGRRSNSKVSEVASEVKFEADSSLEHFNFTIRTLHCRCTIFTPYRDLLRHGFGQAEGD